MVLKTTNTNFRKSTYWNWIGSATSNPGTPLYQYANGQQDLIQSESHPQWREGTGDHGGPFHCVKRTLTEGNFGPVHNRTVVGTAQGDSNPNGENYHGSYFAKYASVTNSMFPDPAIATNSELDALGTTAIARSLPTNPLAGLTVALAEVKREGIPHLLGASLLREKCLRARNAGSEYLNAEFGWRPLVSEVLALANSIENSDELIRKYERESGKLLHRRYTFPEQVTTSSSVATGHYPLPSIKTGFWSGTGSLTTTVHTRVRTWFSGAFTYYLAPQGSVARAEQIAAKRFGHRITPEVLWNLTPWSWAADWVTNIGDVAHNVSAFANDGLVMPYGYMMKETTITNQYSHFGAKLKRQGTAVSCWQTLSTKRMQRRRATPFGFGLDPTSFNGRQWAILGALGLSKGPQNM